MDLYRGECFQLLQSDSQLCRNQAAARADDISSIDAAWGGREAPRIGNFSPEVEPAAKGEHVSQARGADPHLPCQFEIGAWSHEHRRAFAAGMGWGKQEYALHPAVLFE